jgi:hypothetical protein
MATFVELKLCLKLIFSPPLADPRKPQPGIVGFTQGGVPENTLYDRYEKGIPHVALKSRPGDGNISRYPTCANVLRKFTAAKPCGRE